jgi:MoxR-like ATPase
MQTYLTRPVRGSLQTLISEHLANQDDLSSEAERKLENLYQLLFDSTVNVWGTTGNYTEIFQQMDQGDTLLYVAKRERIYLQEPELLLGVEIPASLRDALSNYLWHDDQYKYIWFSTDPVRCIDQTDRDLEAAIQEQLDEDFEYDDWFPRYNANFTAVSPALLDAAGGRDEFIQTVCGGTPSPIAGHIDEYLLVDQEYLVEHNDPLVATKYSANDEFHHSKSDPDEEPEDYGFEKDPRLKYIRLPADHPDRSKLDDLAQSARVFIRDGGAIIATGQVGNIERPRYNGSTRLATVFDYRATSDVLLAEAIPSNRANWLTNNDVEKLSDDVVRQLFEFLSPVELTTNIEDLEATDAFRDDLYRETAAHLAAGKNVVFYGPPGSGKTRAARQISTSLTGEFSIETASANWSNYDVVGGYAPEVENGNRVWRSSPGVLSQAVESCTDTVSSEGRPHWLLLDEMNRANLDEAFGDVFTLLDVDYRQDKHLRYGDTKLRVPFSFRLLATMNETDRAQLFALGYAFRRRFAFVNVPSLLSLDETYNYSSTVEIPDDVGDDIGPKNHDQLRDLIREATVENLQRSRAVPDEYDAPVWPPEDAVTVDPAFARPDTIKTAYSAVVNSDSYGWDSVDGIDVALEFAAILDQAEVVELGQAVLIDFAAFLTAARLIAGENFDRSWVDRGIIAYILPQLDAFMPELKREQTLQQAGSDGQQSPSERYQRVIDVAETFDLPRTVEALRTAETTHRII